MATNSYYLKTRSCWIQIGITILIYIILSFFANFLANPFIPGAIIAIYMPVVVIGGHLQGKVPGFIIGIGATLITSLLKLFLNDPNFIFEIASIIPHGAMGYIAGILGNRKNSILSSLAIIPGHFINVTFFGMFGLIPFNVIIGIYLHIGLIAEIMLNLSIIIFGIRLLENSFYNRNRLKGKNEFFQNIIERTSKLSHQHVFMGLKIGFILSLLLMITIYIYLGGYRRENTRFYLIIYLIPIISAGYWFGLNGSLITSAFVSVIIAHEIFFPSVAEINKIYDPIAFFIIFFNLVAIIIGELKNKWELSRKKVKEMRFQEEKYHNMLSHFLSNYLQGSLFNLQLLKKEYNAKKVFNQPLLNEAIKNIKLSSVTSKKVNNIINIIEDKDSFKQKWQNVLFIFNKTIKTLKQKDESIEFDLKSPEGLNWDLLSDRNLHFIFQELLSFLITSEEVERIVIDGKRTKKFRTIIIKCKNPPKIPEPACSKLSNKITENWIYHGYYLRISHAAIIIQHYGGNLDIICDETRLKFVIKFPIQISRFQSS